MKTVLQGKNCILGSNAFYTCLMPVLLCLIAFTDLQAADLTNLSIEDLINIPVYSAARYEQKTSEAPSSVTIITSDEIKKYGHRTLADILRTVRGLYVTYDRNYSYLGVRGFNRPGDSNSRILVLVDGHRVTENIYDSSYFGADFIADVDMIDRVEIIRGPGSSVYGSNAFFAVINVITRQAQKIKGIEASFDAGSHDTYKGRVSAGHVFSNGAEIAISVSDMESKGSRRLFYPEFASSGNSNGFAEDLDYDRSHNFLATLSYGDFTFQSAYNRREKGIPTAPYGTAFNDPRAQTIDSLFYTDLKYQRQFDGGIETLARINFNRYVYKGIYPYEVDEPGQSSSIVLNMDDTLGQWFGAELQIMKTVLSKHKLTAGFEYRNNIDQNSKNFDEYPYLVYSDINRQSYNWGVFLEVEFEIHKKLLLNTGIRYDYYETFGDSLNPRMALIFRPLEKTVFKLLYGKAFRIPNVWEAFYTDPVSKPNPSLEPETINSCELAYEQQIGDHMFITASFYYNKIQNLINQVTDPSDGLLINKNLDGAKSKGLELEITGFSNNGFRGKLSYAIQKTEDTKTGRELNNSPRHLGKLNLIAPLYNNKFFAGMELQYNSSVITLSGKRENAFWLANANLFAHEFLKGFEFSAGIYNLLDTEYGYPGNTQHLQDSIAQDGRTYRLKFTYAF